MKRYEQIPHTADIAVRVYGENLKELFINAAYAMFDIIADLEGLKNSIEIDVKVNAPSLEELLVSWLDELLYNFCTKFIIFSEFKILSIADNNIVAKAKGKPVGDNKNRLKTEIKAVTYHDLKIKKTPKGVSVDIVFDV